MEESGAHIFHVEGANASGAVAFTGDVSALFLRADDTYVRLDGSIVNGAAEVTLVSDCYHVPGRFSIAIYVSDGETSTCVYAAVGNVYRTSSDVGIDSGDGIPNLVQLTAAYNACVTATEAAQTAALTAVTYAAQTGKTDAEKASARGNINAADAGLVDALHGLVDYGYDTTTTAVGGMTRADMIVSIPSLSLSTGTYVSAWRVNGALAYNGQKSTVETWTSGLKLLNGHKYRFGVHRISGQTVNANGNDANLVQALVFIPGDVDRPGGGNREYGIAPTVLCGTTDSYTDFLYDASVYEAESLAEDMKGLMFALRAYRDYGFNATNAVFLVTLEDITGIVREIPAVPETDGTYTLKATVTNGVPSYAWVSDSGLLSAPLTLGGESE
jgi:hypothetical protein